MKPVAIWLADKTGQIHPYAVRPDGCRVWILKRMLAILRPLLWLLLGYILGQMNV